MALGWLVASLFSVSSQAFAACDLLFPNLRPLPASDIQLVLDAQGQPLELRFGATNWNSGKGRLELVAEAGNAITQKQRVYQRVYNTCGSFQDFIAGDFEWHSTHNHFHFEKFANYSLTPFGNANQGRDGSKTSFCIMDTSSINTQLWGASGQTYSTCGNITQGMSVGWGDTYGSQLDGQSIDATALPPGDYALEINVDPFNRIKESDDDDNRSCVLLRFTGTPYATSFNVLKRRSGRCSDPESSPSIASIIPNEASSGQPLTVIITGTGFDPIMPVSFSNGSLLPSVSNVFYRGSTTLEATVKVGGKKRLSDPVVDLNVGSPFSYTGSAIETDAFTIISR
jgi:hypothetical protein